MKIPFFNSSLFSPFVSLVYNLLRIPVHRDCGKMACICSFTRALTQNTIEAANLEFVQWYGQIALMMKIISNHPFFFAAVGNPGLWFQKKRVRK